MRQLVAPAWSVAVREGPKIKLFGSFSFYLSIGRNVGESRVDKKRYPKKYQASGAQPPGHYHHAYACAQGRGSCLRRKVRRGERGSYAGSSLYRSRGEPRDPSPQYGFPENLPSDPQGQRSPRGQVTSLSSRNRRGLASPAPGDRGISLAVLLLPLFSQYYLFFAPADTGDCPPLKRMNNDADNRSMTRSWATPDLRSRSASASASIPFEMPFAGSFLVALTAASAIKGCTPATDAIILAASFSPPPLVRAPFATL